MIFQRLAVFVISGIFLASVLISGSAWAQNSVSTEFGEFTTDYERYSINNSEETIVKISGIGEMKNFIDNEKVFFTISLPDGSTETMQIFSTKDGYFETFLTLNDTDPSGEWKIFASFGTRILGTIYFDVVKERPPLFGDDNNNAPAPEPFSPSKSSLISVETSSPDYTVGDTIEISGYWKKVVGDGTDNITLQIWSPKNNLILIDQFKPGGTTYSKSIKAGGQMWNSYGEYTVKAQYKNQSVSTTFDLILPKNDPVIPFSPPSELPPFDPSDFDLPVATPPVATPPVFSPPVVTPPVVTPAPIPQTEDDPGALVGIILLVIIIFIIIAIIAKKKSGKKKYEKKSDFVYRAKTEDESSSGSMPANWKPTPPPYGTKLESELEIKSRILEEKVEILEGLIKQEPNNKRFAQVLDKMSSFRQKNKELNLDVKMLDEANVIIQSSIDELTSGIEKKKHENEKTSQKIEQKAKGIDIVKLEKEQEREKKERELERKERELAEKERKIAESKRELAEKEERENKKKGKLEQTYDITTGPNSPNNARVDYQDIGSKIYDEDGNDLVSVSDKLDIANKKLDIANKKLEILQNEINIPKKQQEQEDSEIEMDEHICPKCKKASVKFHKDPSKRTKSEMQLVESIFGWRGSRIQSYCLECRSSKPKKVEIKTTPATSKTDSLYLECEKVIKYKRKNIDVKLVRQCLNLWINEKMRVKEIIKKLYWVDPKKVRRHIQTPERLPNNLKDNVSKYISDPDSIMAISYYVTDHFSWSGKKSDEEKVLKLGKKLAEGFAKNNDLRRKLMGKRN